MKSDRTVCAVCRVANSKTNIACFACGSALDHSAKARPKTIRFSKVRKNKPHEDQNNFDNNLRAAEEDR